MKTPDDISIPQSQFPDAAKFAKELIDAVPKPTSTTAPERHTPDAIHETSKALILIAGQAWRLKTAMNDPESGEMKTELSAQEMRKVANVFEAINQAIEELGIRVIDRCNQDFHPGLPDQVVTEEPRAGISKEQIIRTIRPTIMWHQTMVQRGEIDIAVPATKK
jgi:hypothetical protein